MVKRFLYLARASFETGLILSSAFLGAYLGLNFDKPLNLIARITIFLIVLSVLLKSFIDYKLSKNLKP